ncbi:MAG TPA: CsbD family protein [Opitutaceae bacterium]|nr:CsbD family protein [Opitutaceae bacterium]
MDSLKLKGHLNIAKGKLKQKWAKLTGDNFQLIEGKQDEAIGRIQKRSAATRAESVKSTTKSGSTRSSARNRTPGHAASRNRTEQS